MLLLAAPSKQPRELDRWYCTFCLTGTIRSFVQLPHVNVLQKRAVNTGVKTAVNTSAKTLVKVHVKIIVKVLVNIVLNVITARMSVCGTLTRHN